LHPPQSADDRSDLVFVNTFALAELNMKHRVKGSLCSLTLDVKMHCIQQRHNPVATIGRSSFINFDVRAAMV